MKKAELIELLKKQNDKTDKLEKENKSLSMIIKEDYSKEVLSILLKASRQFKLNEVTNLRKLGIIQTIKIYSNIIYLAKSSIEHPEELQKILQTKLEETFYD